MLTVLLTSIGLVGGAIAWWLQRRDSASSAKKETAASETEVAALQVEQIHQAVAELRAWAAAEVTVAPPRAAIERLTAAGYPPVGRAVTRLAEKRSMSLDRINTDEWMQDHQRLVENLTTVLDAVASSQIQTGKEHHDG